MSSRILSFSVVPLDGDDDARRFVDGVHRGPGRIGRGRRFLVHVEVDADELFVARMQAFFEQELADREDRTPLARAALPPPDESER